eukprot:11852634-Alexandrium_andersonii.AAC.1
MALRSSREGTSRVPAVARYHSCTASSTSCSVRKAEPANRLAKQNASSAWLAPSNTPLSRRLPLTPLGR